MTRNDLDTSGDFPKLQCRTHSSPLPILPVSYAPKYLDKQERDQGRGVVGPLSRGTCDGGLGGNRVNTKAPYGKSTLWGWTSAKYSCTGSYMSS